MPRPSVFKSRTLNAADAVGFSGGQSDPVPVGGGGVQVPNSASEALADFKPLTSVFNALSKVEIFGLASTVCTAVITSGLAQVAIGASERPAA